MEYWNGERETHLRGYFREPNGMTLSQLKYYDDYTRQFIADCENAIEKAKEYRLELAERSEEFLKLSSHVKVSLIRHTRINIEYELIQERIYEDGTSETLDREIYKGKERHKAIKAYNDIKKMYPQYEYYIDIERKAWER